MKTVIHWFRRDLRLTDNTALLAASRAAEQVVPVYILSEWKSHHHWTGPNRQGFLCACLESLSTDLEAVGARLIIRHGEAHTVLRQLVVETKAEAIFYNRGPDPFGRAEEAKIEQMASEVQIAVRACQDVGMHERDELLTGAGLPYRVYSPYFKAWTKLPKPAPGPKVSKLRTAPEVKSDGLPTLAHWRLKSEGAKIIDAGEQAARSRMRSFLGAKGQASGYAEHRGTPAGQTTSRLSQDLRWGLLSIRELYHACAEAIKEGDPGCKEGVDKFVSELAWRDFYFQILYHFPKVLDEDFSPATRGLRWRKVAGHAEQFERWCEGQTGFPIVDAGMRQLSALGFMHNRLRMITAMFFTKDLRFYWREGESFFMQKLVDGEIASNNGGWQWSAGTGADAAPYFRVQNPWTQSERFDPKGEYIREWVPELREVPPGRLHSAPSPGQRLAKSYPLPMLDHTKERDLTLEMFRSHHGYKDSGKTELREE